MSRFGDLLAGKSSPAPTPAPAPAPEPVVEPVVEEVEEESEEEESEGEPDLSLYDMTKKELEEYGRTIGVELDRRHGRTRLISELQEHLTDDEL